MEDGLISNQINFDQAIWNRADRRKAISKHSGLEVKSIDGRKLINKQNSQKSQVNEKVWDTLL